MGRRAAGLAAAVVAAGVVVLHALGGTAGGEATDGPGPGLMQAAGQGPGPAQAAGTAPAEAATALPPPDPPMATSNSPACGHPNSPSSRACWQQVFSFSRLGFRGLASTLGWGKRTWPGVGEFGWPPGDPAAPLSASAPDAQPCEAVATPQGPAAAAAPTLALARQAAAQRLAGGDAAERTLALLLQAPPADDAAQRAAWATQVLASALASSDAPTLRAAAASACPHAGDARGCRLQLIQRRIELDPGNASPWVEWLDEDPAAADEAWAGLAAASHWRDDPQRLAATLGQALDPRLPATHRQALQAEAAALDADAPAAALSALQTPCGHWGATHTRGQACAHGVALMLGQADSPRTALEGAALARGMGWAEAQIEAAQAQARRLLDTAPAQAPPACGPRTGLAPG